MVLRQVCDEAGLQQLSLTAEDDTDRKILRQLVHVYRVDGEVELKGSDDSVLSVRLAGGLTKLH